MSTPSPLHWLVQRFDSLLPLVQPPAWLMQEAQQRLVLLLNHILGQEPIATVRLRRVAGQRVDVRWRQWTFAVVFTPAGLLDVGDAGQSPHLVLQIEQDSPLDLLQTLVQGRKPSIHIEGDVQLAAEINWLIDHVRWDIEEDLARLMGDASAHTLVNAARQVSRSLRDWVGKMGTHGTPRQQPTDAV